MEIYLCGGCTKRFVEGVNTDDIRTDEDGRMYHIIAKIEREPGKPALLTNLKRSECGPIKNAREIFR